MLTSANDSRRAFFQCFLQVPFPLVFFFSYSLLRLRRSLRRSISRLLLSFSSNYGFLLLFELRQLFFIPLSVIFDVESHGLYFFKDNVVSFFFFFLIGMFLCFSVRALPSVFLIYIFICVFCSQGKLLCLNRAITCLSLEPG